MTILHGTAFHIVIEIGITILTRELNQHVHYLYGDSYLRSKIKRSQSITKKGKFVINVYDILIL